MSTFVQILKVATIKKVWVFASGSGSNAEKLFAHFSGHPTVRITGLFCNNAQAGVLDKATAAAVPTYTLTNSELAAPGNLLDLLTRHGVEYIILAGFLRKIPDDVIQTYADKIINIHPALLPKFGGKGMYGMHVHRAVKEAGEAQTGISIHLVNERYDEGRILFQTSVPVMPNDTPENIAQKVQELEHTYFAAVCDEFITQD